MASIDRWLVFWQVGLQGVVMLASHGVAHAVMQHFVAESDVGGGYSDRICLEDLS